MKEGVVMGHGWKTISREIVSKKACSCGKGNIIEWEIEEESDHSFHNRFDNRTEFTCPDKCHIRK